MKNIRTILLGAMMTLSAAGVSEAANNVLTPAETKAGFKLLFDGANSSQWSINWAINDSAMYSPNTGAMIYSKEEFTNFEWKVDFKVNAGGNSGFFIRTKNDWYCDGFEVGVLDSKAGGDADARSNSANGDKLSAGIFNVNKNANFVTGSDAPIKRSGSIYDMYPTTKDGILIPKGGVYVDRMKASMEWNSMVIWANGNNIETWLNGMKVTDFVIGSEDYMARFHRSKFGNGGNQCGDDFGKLPGGKLVVQDHGGGLYIWMRNIKMRPITAGGKLTAPTLTPNGGTFAGATKVDLDNGITGSAIRYTLDGSTPSETSPLYNDSTGLSITSTTTVKTAAFRTGFAASDVATATFTISGSGINGKGSNLAPEVVLSQHGKQLNITNRNGIPFMMDLIALDGKKVRSRNIDKAAESFSLEDMKSGVYVVKMHAGAWLHTRRIAVP